MTTETSKKLKKASLDLPHSQALLL